MTDSKHDETRYPVGRFDAPVSISADRRAAWIADVRELPAQLSAAVHGLNDTQLDTPYREHGWTVRQVVHHVADSHMNSYIRFRWALTEDHPPIKTYEQGMWAGLPDACTAPVAISLTLLEALHARWILLLTAMTDADFARGLQHPELGELKLDWMLGLYAWHGRHHTAHIQGLRSRQNW